MGAMSSEKEAGPNYVVVVNHDDEYSIWPSDRTAPADWREAGKLGTKSECLAFIIKRVWMASFGLTRPGGAGLAVWPATPGPRRDAARAARSDPASCGDRGIEAALDDLVGWRGMLARG